MSIKNRLPGRPAKYPPEFQRDAVAMVLDEGRSIGVVEGTLGNWVGKARRERAAGTGVSADERAENTQLRMERDSMTGATVKPHHQQRTAEGDAAERLADAPAATGMVPNMYGVMANSPGLLATYLDGYQRFRIGSGFTPAEQETVFLTISGYNACDYCMAAHSFIADHM